MTEEEQKILFKDLCARLPYGVKCERYGKAYELVEIDIKRGLVYVLRDDWYTPTPLPYRIGCDDIRPFLRPMSSMTDEEKKEYDVMSRLDDEYAQPYDSAHLIDWLNAHHFDYRGLIEKGLALEAPVGMYEKED